MLRTLTQLHCLRILMLCGMILVTLSTPSPTNAARIYWQGCGTVRECVEPGGLLLFSDDWIPPFQVIEVWFSGDELVAGNHAWVGGWIDTDLMSFCMGAIMVAGQSGVCACCHNRTGNVDSDFCERVDISDLSALIGYLYLNQGPLGCLSAANCDGSPDGNLDIGDLTALIDYLYISFTPTASCP